MQHATRFALPALLLLALGCKATPSAGDPAPSFTAMLQSGNTASLESLMGEKGIILYFYPKDETPGCIRQACQFQEKLIDFQKAGYNVVGVSEDTGQSHQAFRENRKLTFDLISDTDHALANLYGVPVEKDPIGTLGFRRTTFVISRDGVVRQRFEVSDPEEQVQRAYKAALGEPF